MNRESEEHKEKKKQNIKDEYEEDAKLTGKRIRNRGKREGSSTRCREESIDGRYADRYSLMERDMHTNSYRELRRRERRRTKKREEEGMGKGRLKKEELRMIGNGKVGEERRVGQLRNEM